MPSFLKLLSSVTTPPVVLIAAAAVNARNALDLPGDTIITSGNDKTHKRGSLHYRDRALDFRTRDLSAADAQRWAKEVKRRLGRNFDVVVEGDHLHIEHDPK
jgi:hypothetical protein